NIDLLADWRAVQTIGPSPLRLRRLHCPENRSGKTAAADSVECQGRAGLADRSPERVFEVGRRAVENILCPGSAQQVRLRLASHNVDQTDSVGAAQAVEHLPQIRGCSGMDQRPVTLALHG